MSKRFLIWYWSASGGGGSQFAVNLARRLALRFGGDSLALSLHADDPVLAELSSCPFEVLGADVTSGRGAPLATLAGLKRASDVLKKHGRNADCVIIPMNFAVAAPLSFALDKPLVYFAHDPDPHPGDYAVMGQRVTQTVLLGRARHIVAMSQYAAHHLTRMGVESARLHLAPLVSVFPPDADRRSFGEPVRMLFAGRMLSYKGIDLLSGALQLIGARKDWRVSIVGHGPALTSGADARFDVDQVDLVDARWISASSFSERLKACEVLLAPYTSATQSGVVAQALAFGKPCVVTPAGALPEQIGFGEAGWVAANVDPGAFAEALTAMLDDANARARKAGAARVLARTAWETDYWDWLGAV